MKAKTFLNKLHRLQSEIYDYQSELKDKGEANIAEVVGTSGFSLDDACQEMEKAVKLLKILSKNKKG